MNSDFTDISSEYSDSAKGDKQTQSKQLIKKIRRKLKTRKNTKQKKPVPEGTDSSDQEIHPYQLLYDREKRLIEKESIEKRVLKRKSAPPPEPPQIEGDLSDELHLLIDDQSSKRACRPTEIPTDINSHIVTALHGLGEQIGKLSKKVDEILVNQRDQWSAIRGLQAQVAKLNGEAVEGLLSPQQELRLESFNTRKAARTIDVGTNQAEASSTSSFFGPGSGWC